MIFKRLFRWQFWRWRYHYWRKRAVQAERLLEAERWRNQEREDTLVTVPMRMAGLFGMPARSAPALTKQVVRPALVAPTDPWDTLTFADRQEFEMFWKPDAERAGVPMRDAQQKFLQELENRRHPLNDEAFS